jgi:hypothetical protein
MATNDELFSPLDGLGTGYGKFDAPTPDVTGYTPFEGDRLKDPSINFPQTFFPPAPNIGSLTVPNQQIRTNVTGAPPRKAGPARGASPKDIVTSFNKMIKAQSQANPDNNYYAKIHSYDAGPAGPNFYKRYQAYGQETFDKIGFHPLRNNEAVFTEQTSGWDDFTRMLKHSAWPLFSRGFVSAPKSLFKAFQGDFSADTEDARVYEEAAAIGQSSRGGIGAFTSNLAMNFAYTAGIISEAIIEEAGLGLLTAATGGGAAPAWMASLANKGNQFKNLFRTLSKADNVVDASNIYRKSLKAMDNVDDTRRIWSAQKADKALNSGIGRFFNPVENTANAIMKGIKNEDNLTGLARAYTTGYNTVGGLYRDVRSINMALAEARLEGGMTQNDVYKELYNRYYEKTGRAPSDAEQELMIKQSKDAATTSMMWNTGLIYLSNKVVLDNIVGAGKGITGWTRGKIDDILDLKTGKVIKETEEVVLKSGKKFQKPKYKWEENTFKNKLLNIKKNPVSGTLSFAGTYLKGNIMEAGQEVAQEVIGDATKKYYVSTFKNEHLRTQQYATGLAKSAFDDLFSTSRGWETAASGFFMGMFAGPLNKSVELMSVGYDKYFNPEQYNEYKKVRDEYGKRIVNTLSSVDMNEFFNSRIWNYGVQGSMSDLRLADSEKLQRDAQDQAFITQMNTVLENDMMNHFIENLESYKGLTAEEFEEAFPNVPQGEGAKYIAKLDETIDRAKNLEKKYNFYKERFPDPVSAKDLEGLAPESKEYQNAQLLNEAWKVARYNGIFFSETFENVTKRMSGILDSVASQKLLKNASASDITVLFDPKLLANQADILRDEIDMMSKTEGTRPKDLLERKQKLEALDNYDKAVNTYLSFTMTKEAIAEKFINRAKMQGKELSDEELDSLVESEMSKRSESDQVEAAKQLEIAYKDYLKTLAGQTGDYVFDEQIDDSFIKLIDYYKLSDEAKLMNTYANLLMNPAGYLEQVEKNQEWMSELYNNRKEYYQEMVQEAIKAKESNDLLNFLASRNIYVSLDDFQRFLETGILPDEFYNDTNNTVIKRSNPEYIELARAFIKFNELNKQVIKAQSADETLRETLKNLDEKMMDEIEALEKSEVRNELGPIPTKKKGIGISDVMANVEDGQYADLIYMEGKDETQITVYRDGDVLKYNNKEGEEVNPKLKTKFISGVKYEIKLEPDAAEVEAIKEKYRAIKDLKVEEALAEKEKEQFEEDKFVEITPSTPIEEFPADLYNELYLMFEDYIDKTNIEVQDDEFTDRLANFIRTNSLAAEVIAEYNKNKKLEIATAPTGEVIVPTITTRDGKEVSVDELPEEEVRSYLNSFLSELKVLETKDKLEPQEQNRLYQIKRVADDLQKYVDSLDKTQFTEAQLATIEVLNQIKLKNEQLVRTPNGYIIDDTLHKRVTTEIQKLVSKGYQYTDIGKIRIAFNSTLGKTGLTVDSVDAFINKLREESPKGFSEYTYTELDQELKALAGQPTTAGTQADIERKSNESVKDFIERLFSNNYFSEVDGKQIFSLTQGRWGVVVNINGVQVPFYQSTSGTDTKVTGQWYPFFGDLGNWVIKGNSDDSNIGYGFKAIQNVQKFLNDNIKETDAIALSGIISTDVNQNKESLRSLDESKIKGNEKISLNKEATAKRLADVAGYSLEEGRKTKSDLELFELASKKIFAELAALEPKATENQVDRKAAVIEAGLGRELENIVRDRLRNEGVTQAERNKLTLTQEQSISLATEADYKTLLENNKRKLKEEEAKFEASQKEDFDPTTGEFETGENVAFYQNKIKSIEGIINIKPTAKPQFLTKAELRELVENLVQEKTYEDARIAGNYVDRAIRDFFAGRTPEFNEKYITKEAYDSLFGDSSAVDASGNRTSIGYLELAKQRLEEQGLYLYSEGLVLNDVDAVVAGEIDLIMVDRQGRVFIVDVKTGDATKWGNFNDPKNQYSKKEDYELQQTTYSNLLFNMTGLNSLVSLMPIEITKDKETGKILTASAPKAKDLLKPESFRIPLSKETKSIGAVKTITDTQRAEIKGFGITDSQIELMTQREIDLLLNPELRSEVMIEDLKKKYKNADTVLGKTIQERVDTIVPRKDREASIIQTGRPVSEETVKKLKSLGFTDEMIGIMSAEDIEEAKKIRRKADAKTLIDKYAELLPKEGSEGDQAPPKNSTNANQNVEESAELRQFREGLRGHLAKMDLIALDKYEAETVANLIKNKQITAEFAIIASEEIQARREELKQGAPSEVTPVTIEKGSEYAVEVTIFETRNPNNIFAKPGDVVRVVSSTENKVVVKNSNNKQKTLSFEEFNKMLILKENVMQPSTDTSETLTPEESSIVDESNSAAMDLLDSPTRMAELQKEAEDSKIEDLEKDFLDSIDEC